MNHFKNLIFNILSVHRSGLLLFAVILLSGGMLIKGIVLHPQIKNIRKEITTIQSLAEEEKNRQSEIDDLKTKVNTDEYIERIASEKLGLVKSNAKIFIDVSEEN